MFLLMAACVSEPAPTPYRGAVVALQDQSAMGFLGPEGELLDVLPLSSEVSGETIAWMIHNVQITPDGTTALATAMAPMDPAPGVTVGDQLVIVDLASRAVRRCELDVGAAVAHVVSDGITAWITAYDAERVLVVDLATCLVGARWPLPAGTGPHGIRASADGASFFVAGYGDGALLRIDAATGAATSWPLPAPAVQVAVLADGSAVLATLLETRQLARLDLQRETVTLLDLPAGATGPAQIYPSPDGRSVWVADQGAADLGIAGRELFWIDAENGSMLGRVLVHEAPHGVVVSADGGTVWTTTLTSGTVDRIDVATLTMLGSTPVGPGPNGISLSDADGAAP